MDLYSGNWQAELDEANHEKTALSHQEDYTNLKLSYLTNAKLLPSLKELWIIYVT